MSTELQIDTSKWQPPAGADTAIDSDITLAQAGDVLRGVKALQAEVKGTFRPLISKAHGVHRDLIAAEKKHLDPLLKAETALKRRIAAYHDEIREVYAEAARMAAQAAADEEWARLRRAEYLAPADARTLLEQPTETAAIVVPDVPVMEGVSVVETWHARVVDILEVPREYLVPDMAALNALARRSHGTARVAGIEFYSETGVRARTKAEGSG